MGEGPEPSVRAQDVVRILERVIVDGSPDKAERRAAVAEEAELSVETVKRIMRLKWKWLPLDRADRLVVAAGGHLSECEVRVLE